MDHFIDGRCPLEVQRACGLFAEDYHRRQGRCAPLVWNAARPRSDELCPPQNAGRRPGGTWFYGLSANPLRGDSAGVRWPPYRRGPLGRSRREATPICRLRSPWKMAVPGPGMIVSASVADDFPCRPGGAGHRVPMSGVAPKEHPYLTVGAVWGAFDASSFGSLSYWHRPRIALSDQTREAQQEGKPGPRASRAANAGGRVRRRSWRGRLPSQD
jgi:hypothetical protein